MIAFRIGELARGGDAGAIVESSTDLALRLSRAIETFADRPACRGGRWQPDYRSLGELARACSSRLCAAGLAPNEPVLVKVSNRAEDFAAFLGVWMAGGVVVPVHRSVPPAVLELMQAKARARFELDPDPDDRKALHALRAVAVGEPGPSTCSAGADRPLLDDAAFVIFTSGSTGAPKGVVLTHSRFAAKLDAIRSMLPALAPGDGVLLVLNNTFSFGIWMALLCLLSGGCLVLRERFDPADFAQTLVRERIVRVGVVPTMMRSMAAGLSPRAIVRAAHALRQAQCLREVLIGGESLGLELSARVRRLIAPARLYDIYGLTETSTCDFFLLPDDYPAHPDSIGRASPGVRWRIVDGAGADVHAGETGELMIRSEFVMAGYLDDPQLTAASLRAGWLATGDLARAGADGFVSIVGRSKELIVRGGNKVTPQEIERAACECPGVAAAMAAGLPDPVMGQRIHLMVVAAPGAALDAGSLVRFLRGRLERFKQPDYIYLGDGLPTGRTGKLDRRRLQEMIVEGMPAASAAS